jgi:proteasome maturation protein
MPLPDFPIPGQAPKPAAPGSGLPVNPVEEIQKAYLVKTERDKLMRASALHGQHAPLRLMMERNILSQHRRLPGLRSGLVGLSESLGLDDDFQPEDLFNQEGDCPTVRPGTMDLHSTMEDRMGLSMNVREVTSLDLTTDASKSFACSMAL